MSGTDEVIRGRLEGKAAIVTGPGGGIGREQAPHALHTFGRPDTLLEDYPELRVFQP